MAQNDMASFAKEPGAKTCPKCLKQTLSYDAKLAKLSCSNCGFEQTFRRGA